MYVWLGEFFFLKKSIYYLTIRQELDNIYLGTLQSVEI